MATDSASLNPTAVRWNCHDKLVKLANMQEARVLALLPEERKSRLMILKLNTLIKNYVDLLCRIQEIEFDLGLVAYQRGITKEAIDAAARQEQERYERMAKAMKIMDDFFRANGIGPEDTANIHEHASHTGEEEYAQI